MTTTVKCIKCGAENPALVTPPFRAGTRLASLGVDIQNRVCGVCYKDWIAMSVKLVNELRLDTTDPRSQEFWLAQMKLFLGLDTEPLGQGPGKDPWARHMNTRVAIETTDGRRVTATLLGVDERSINLAEFDGGAIPEGFAKNAQIAAGAFGNGGSATIARDRVRTLEPAAVL